jgi:hypothetical protein
VASNNKQILLIAINTMEKHINDIKHERRNQLAFKRTRDFLKFIGETEIKVCIHLNSGKKLEVMEQINCPHTKLDYVEAFVRGGPKTQKRHSLWGGLLPKRTKAPQTTRASLRPTETTKNHVDSIQEFASEFVKIKPVQAATESEQDEYDVGAAFFCYLNII